jgi:hypothetical protein
MLEKTTLKPPFREDLTLQTRVWWAERSGWAAMALLVVGGLLGAFSHGFLSETTAVSGDGSLSVAYERLARKTARTRFVISLPHVSQDTGIVLSPSFQQTYDIEVLYPLPLRSTAGAGGLELVFAPSAGGDLLIHMAARPNRFGIAALSVETGGQRRASFTQFIYP